jgi:hypothetical protein
VAPCPVGSFSNEYSLETSCTECEDAIGAGVTTAAAGANSSAACNVLQPGVAFVDRSKVVVGEGDSPKFGAITGQSVGGNTTKACPQSFYW